MHTLCASVTEDRKRTIEEMRERMYIYSYVALDTSTAKLIHYFYQGTLQIEQNNMMFRYCQSSGSVDLILLIIAYNRFSFSLGKRPEILGNGTR